MNFLYSQVITRHGGEDAQIGLTNEVTRRMKVDNVFEKLEPTKTLKTLKDSPTAFRPRNFGCLRKLMATYADHCGPMTDYDLQYVPILVELCESLTSDEEVRIPARKITKACAKF